MFGKDFWSQNIRLPQNLNFWSDFSFCVPAAVQLAKTGCSPSADRNKHSAGQHITQPAIKRRKGKLVATAVVQPVAAPLCAATDPCQPVRTRTLDVFDFSLEPHWRARARMSIQFRCLLAVDLFAEDACFLETYFRISRNMSSRNRFSQKYVFFLRDGIIQKKELFLTQKLFITFWKGM